MEEALQEEWYYTQGDDRIGPVSYAALKSLAADGFLNPRHDMVWMAGMPDWKPAGEIEGLFERRTPIAEQESLAPPADSYKPPEDHSAAEIMGRQTDWPGAGRLSFWFMTLIFPFLWVAGVAYLAPKLMEIEYAQDTMPMIILGINLVPLFLAIAVYLKRFVNLGMSRWWFLGVFSRSSMCGSGIARIAAPAASHFIRSWMGSVSCSPFSIGYSSRSMCWQS